MFFIFSETFLIRLEVFLLMDSKTLKKHLKKTWHFIWEDDSALSWIVNIILAFILIKFIVYPGLGFVFGTNYPVVAVVSGSMEHDGNFDAWWNPQKDFYLERNITKEEFEGFRFKNGFNTGDIMVLFGKAPEKIKVGDVIVFSTSARPDPIIHRVVNIFNESGVLSFQTKGDHNPDINYAVSEGRISKERYIGKAVFRIPYLGWIKIGAVNLKDLIF